jgi:hypothetical protein
MLNGAKDFDRYSVRAADDAVGGVDDLYFDDESWTNAMWWSVPAARSCPAGPSWHLAS